MLQLKLPNEWESKSREKQLKQLWKTSFQGKKIKAFFLVLGGVNGIIFINIQLECKCTFTKKYLSKYHQ